MPELITMLCVFVIIVIGLREVYLFFFLELLVSICLFRQGPDLIQFLGSHLQYYLCSQLLIYLFIYSFFFFTLLFSFFFQKTCLFTVATLYLSPMLDPTACKFLSLNVRGLKNKKKRSSIFSYLKDQNCHFYFLQETYSEPKDEIVWKSEWGGEMAPTGRKVSAF